MLKLFITIFIICGIYANESGETSIFDIPDRSIDERLIYKNDTTPKQDIKNLQDKNDAILEQNIRRKLGENTPINLEQQLKNIVPTDEPDLNIPDSQVYETIKKREIILRTINIPKSVFVGEIFEVRLSVNPQSEFDFEFITNIDESNVKWINSKNIQWVKQDDKSYIATIFLQGKSENAKSTKIELNLKRNGEIYQNGSINLFLPKFKPIRAKSDFSHIVADTLKVRKFKTTKFDESNLIMIVELYGKNIDLSSFKLKDKTILKQGIDTIVGDFSSQSGYFFAVFKPNKTTLDFSYYDLSTQTFKDFSLPVSVEDDEVSTQIGLNPKQNEISIYKNISLYSLSVIFFILTIIRRKTSYAITTIIFIALSIYNYNPFSKGTLKSDVNVRILPTERSTIFYTSSSNEGIEILGERAEYLKILFNDGKIGWVKKDDIIKN